MLQLLTNAIYSSHTSNNRWLRRAFRAHLHPLLPKHPVMLHPSRTYTVCEVDTTREITSRLAACDHRPDIGVVCADYVFLNDAFSEESTPEFVVLKATTKGAFRELFHFRPQWMPPDHAQVIVDLTIRGVH